MMNLKGPALTVLLLLLFALLVALGGATAVYGDLDTKRSGYWQVIDDQGVQISRHAEQDKALASAANWAIENPAREVEIVAPRWVTTYTPDEPADPTPDPDTTDPDPDADPTVKETHISTMAADAKLGETSTIGYSKQGEKYVIYASARMVEGYHVILHVQDTETWEVVGGDSIEAAGEDVTDYHLDVWAELEAGKRYRAETWTVRHLEDGSKEDGTKTRVIITPEKEPS